MKIRAYLLGLVFALGAWIGAPYAQSPSQLSEPKQATKPSPSAKPEPPPNPLDPKCCWVFVPSSPTEVEGLCTFDGKIDTGNVRDSAVKVELLKSKGRVYTIKKTDGQQDRFLRTLKKGD